MLLPDPAGVPAEPFLEGVGRKGRRCTFGACYQHCRNCQTHGSVNDVLPSAVDGLEMRVESCLYMFLMDV